MRMTGAFSKFSSNNAQINSRRFISFHLFNYPVADGAEGTHLSPSVQSRGGRTRFVFLGKPFSMRLNSFIQPREHRVRVEGSFRGGHSHFIIRTSEILASSVSIIVVNDITSHLPLSRQPFTVSMSDSSIFSAYSALSSWLVISFENLQNLLDLVFMHHPVALELARHGFFNVIPVRPLFNFQQRLPRGFDAGEEGFTLGDEGIDQPFLIKPFVHARRTYALAPTLLFLELVPRLNHPAYLIQRIFLGHTGKTNITT